MTAFDERDQGPPRSLTSRPGTEFLPIAEKGSWFELLVFVLSRPGDVTFASAAWLMERRWPELFSRPEVQLNLIQQNNVTENRLSITISMEEIREIEAEAAPSREKVR